MKCVVRDQRTFDPGRGDLEPTLVAEVGEGARDLGAEVGVDALGMLDQHADEVLRLDHLDVPDLDVRADGGDGSGDGLQVGRSHELMKKAGTIARFRGATGLSTPGAGRQCTTIHKTIVTGPSFTSATSIDRPKRPVATSMPSARRASTKAS